MKIVIEQQDDISLVRPNGKLDALTSTAFHDALDGILKSGAKRIVVDMTQVPYISSAGLRVFVQVAKQLIGSGKLVVSGLSGGTKQVFTMAGFDKIMSLCDDLETAKSAV